MFSIKQNRFSTTSITIGAVVLLIFSEALFAINCAVQVNHRYSLSIYQELRLWYQQAYLQHNYDLAKMFAVKAMQQASDLHDDGFNLAIAREDLADLMIAEGNLADGTKLLKTSLADFQKREHSDDFVSILSREHELSCYSTLTKACLSLGQLPDAESYCKSGLVLSAALKDNLNVEAVGRSTVGLFQELGDLKLKQSDFAAAGQAYSRALQITDGLLSCDDRKAEMKLKLANVFEITGDHSSSDELLQGSEWAKHLRDGDACRRDHPDQSQRYYLLALDQAKGSSCSALEPCVYEALARSYAARNELSQAESMSLLSIALRARLQVTPELRQTRGYLAELYAAQGKHAQAVKLLEEMVADPENFESQYTRMRLKTDLGQEYQYLHGNDKALSCANDAFDEINNRDNLSTMGIVTRLKLARLFLSLNDIAKAQAVFSSAQAFAKSWIGPDDQQSPFIAHELSAVQRSIEARKNLEQPNAWPGWFWSDDLIDNKQKDRSTALRQRAQEVLRTSDVQGSLALANDLVEREHSPRSFSLRAQAYMKLKEYQKAIDDLDRVIPRHPGKAKWFVLRAQAYENLHKYESALTNYNSALQVDDQDPAVLSARAALYRKLGRPASANADMVRVKQLQSGPRS